MAVFPPLAKDDAPLRPQSLKGISPETIREILFKAKGILRTGKSLESKSVTSDLPEELSFQLTYGCNLRCSHCFQWGDTGYHEAGLEAQERGLHLKFSILQRCLEATKSVSPRVLLWGGEPLIYRHWNELVELLVNHQNDIVVSTNGVRIRERMESICRLPASATILVSLDGSEQQHDNIRGKGNYRRSIEGIRELMKKRQLGQFHGKVSIGAVISDNCVPGLLNFCRAMESEGVDAVHLVFPWFINSEASRGMDSFVKGELAWLMDWNLELDRHPTRSWEGYSFRVSLEAESRVIDEVLQVASVQWKMPVRFQPSLRPSELSAFLQGKPGPFADRSHCLSIYRRLSVLADGSVTTCKLFPEMKYGRLDEEDVLSLWRGERAENLRCALSKSGTPVCARCSQLYLDGM
jgi:MoaA/NifB/PqqE/SkfB family radical SAM enzyme